MHAGVGPAWAGCSTHPDVGNTVTAATITEAMARLQRWLLEGLAAAGKPEPAEEDSAFELDSTAASDAQLFDTGMSDDEDVSGGSEGAEFNATVMDDDALASAAVEAAWATDLHATPSLHGVARPAAAEDAGSTAQSEVGTRVAGDAPGGEVPGPPARADCLEPRCGPLALAAHRGDVKEVKRHLRRGVEPNEQDERGETPLFAAARGGHAKAAAVLLLGFADPGLTSVAGLQAADVAGAPPVAALLWLAVGAQVDARDQRDAFGALEEDTQWLLAVLLERRGIRLAVRDVWSEEEWEEACT